MRYIFILMMLSGCAPSLGFDYTYKCVTITAELDLVESRLHKHIDLAQEMIDDRFGKGKFCSVYSRDVTEVLISGFPCMAYSDGCSGESIMGHVRLSVYGNSMVHETIHVIEGMNGLVSTAWHQGWAESGYFELDDTFTVQASTMR